MSGKSQTALERYKTRRGGDASASPADPDSSDRSTFQWKYVRVVVLLVLLGGIAWPLIPHPQPSIQLTYEIDLASAPEGSLVVTMMVEGNLPGKLDLEFPPGVFGDEENGVSISAPAAHVINEDGSQGNHLIIDRSTNGWVLQTGGARRAGFIYQVDLTRTRDMETDIRRYISTPVNGGIRAAGFEVFLEPVGLTVEDITVTVYNPRGLSLLVPWPALVRGNQVKPADPEILPPVQEAHLGFGEGFQPADLVGEPTMESQRNLDRAPTTVPVPTNLFYHPRDLADLNNALLICGDIRISTAQARDCVIQYATDRTWYFEDERMLDLIRKIARTEIGFFGSAPTDQITVLLAANEVSSPDGFDVYGVHTGSSVLVMIDPETTWGVLEEQVASIIAHEMFHGWLGEAVKQEDPATLWFTEGATSWYSSRILSAAGVWEPSHAKKLLDARLDRDYAQSDLLGRISIAEASSQVMASNEVVRFSYAGATAACMALDTYLNQSTGKKAPLDLVVRHLYQTRDGEGLTREKLEATILLLTNVDCGPWLDTYVYGPRALPPMTEPLAAR